MVNNESTIRKIILVRRRLSKAHSGKKQEREINEDSFYDNQILLPSSQQTKIGRFMVISMLKKAVLYLIPS